MNYYRLSTNTVTVSKSKIQRCLHLCTGDDIKTVIQFEENISYHCLAEHTDGWILYCVSCNGNLYKVLETDTSHTSAPTIRRGSDNLDIFTDLLEETTSNGHVELHEASEPLLHVTKSSAIFTFDSPVYGLASYDDALAVCTQKNGAYVVGSYRIGAEKSQIVLLNSFCLPCTSDNSSKPCLVYFCSCPLIEGGDKSAQTLSSLNLPTELYTSTFGRSPALLKSPILLFCPPEGSVYYAPLKSLDRNNSHFDWTEFKMLCNTSQPIVSMQIAKLKVNKLKEDSEFDMESEPDDFVTKDVMMIAAEDGKCVIVVEDEGSRSQFLSVTLPGPCKDFCACGSSVFVTTGEEVYQTVLELKIQNGTPGIEMTNSQRMYLMNVVQLFCIPDNTQVTEEVSKLMCKFKDGSVKVVDPKDRANTAECDEGVDSGQKIKDLLQSIENCRLENAKVDKLKQEQTTFFQQLHLAAYFLSTDSQTSDLFQYRVTTNSPVSGTLSDICICCEMTNQGKVILSTDWSVMVTVQQTDWNNKSVNKSVHLAKNLESGETISILTPLPSENLLIPFQVEITLILHLPETFQKQDLHKQPTLSIPVHSESVDILYFMHPEKSFQKHVQWTCPSSNDIIHQMALKRPISNNLMEREVKQSKVTEKSCNLEIYISLSSDGKELGELDVLSSLLKNLPESSEKLTNPIQLVSLSGYRVSIGVLRSQNKDQPPTGQQAMFKVTVQANTTRLAAAVRCCLLRHCETQNSTLSFSADDLKVLREANSSLRDLQARVGQIKNNSMVESSQQILSIYKQLRQINKC